MIIAKNKADVRKITSAKIPTSQIPMESAFASSSLLGAVSRDIMFVLVGDTLG